MEVEPKSAVRTESGWKERVRKCHGANAADPFLSHLAAGRKHSTRSEIVKPEIQEMGPLRRAHDFRGMVSFMDPARDHTRTLASFTRAEPSQGPRSPRSSGFRRGRISSRPWQTPVRWRATDSDSLR